MDDFSLSCVRDCIDIPRSNLFIALVHYREILSREYEGKKKEASQASALRVPEFLWVCTLAIVRFLKLVMSLTLGKHAFIRHL